MNPGLPAASQQSRPYTHQFRLSLRAICTSIELCDSFDRKKRGLLNCSIGSIFSKTALGGSCRYQPSQQIIHLRLKVFVRVEIAGV
jgi:hypothetical protein